ncbi:energy-coupling factor transporter transmembrane component T [Corynebacterium lowii]|uniref:Cobalt transport protein n=1 Tax=Corynebacterium lowii TaxID=1544413 RepID=A0A0Q0YI49_9CORY|nr:energy-coupling factor transporter transmembrane component T [Corynebacterium lowii]KQB86325.1 Cobalt transport protein [Corynebacterium lowii]MDP9850810.1 energy-coupling factor transport system permease protein [Corynebacterium lowii]
MSEATPAGKSPHPFTSLSLAASAWILVVGLNSPWVSGCVVALAWALSAARHPAWRVPAWSLGLSAPVAASMLIIHAPHGHNSIAPLLTSDGLVVAAVLSLRFLALVTAVVAAVASFRVADLAKALQGAGVVASLGYVVGATLQLAPEVRVVARKIRQANDLAGRSTKGLAVIPRVVLPLITQVVSGAVRRADTLETIGVGLPGARTVLRPVPDSTGQRLVRWLIPLLCVMIVIAKVAL